MLGSSRKMKIISKKSMQTFSPNFPLKDRFLQYFTFNSLFSPNFPSMQNPAQNNSNPISSRPIKASHKNAAFYGLELKTSNSQLEASDRPQIVVRFRFIFDSPFPFQSNFDYLHFISFVESLWKEKKLKKNKRYIWLVAHEKMKL